MNKKELKNIIREVIKENFNDYFYKLDDNNYWLKNESIIARELLIFESFNYNLDDTFPIIGKTNLAVEFKDDNGISNVTKGNENNGFIELKLYWIDETKIGPAQIRFNSPPNVTSKTMNTHLSNIFKYFLPFHDKFLIRGNDPPRQRLFRFITNKFFDKTKWKIEEKEKGTQIQITKIIKNENN